MNPGCVLPGNPLPLAFCQRPLLNYSVNSTANIIHKNVSLKHHTFGSKLSSIRYDFLTVEIRRCGNRLKIAHIGLQKWQFRVDLVYYFITTCFIPCRYYPLWIQWALTTLKTISMVRRSRPYIWSQELLHLFDVRYRISKHVLKMWETIGLKADNIYMIRRVLQILNARYARSKPKTVSFLSEWETNN